MFGKVVGGILSGFFGQMIGANAENDINDDLTYWWYKTFNYVMLMQQRGGLVTVFQYDIAHQQV